MKILTVSAQKPNATGSGVYLKALVENFMTLGVDQCVVAGVYESDFIHLPSCVSFYPVKFQTKELPFYILGMSDEMPYESTRYIDLTAEQISLFQRHFLHTIQEAVAHEKPDVILCHHLYFLTAIVREAFPEHKIVGICHGTDLRQLKQHDLKNEFIKRQIQKLDYVFALHEEQKAQIQGYFDLEQEKVTVVGSGYNNKIFYQEKSGEKFQGKNLIFAGKLSKSKGVFSLLRAFEEQQSQEATLYLAGGTSNEIEYQKLVDQIHKMKKRVVLLGKLPQEELATYFRRCQVFVLSSFYEGLPLVLLEALASGPVVVCTRLKGVKEWLDLEVKDHGVLFVDLPPIQNVDQPLETGLPDFEKRLSKTLAEAFLHKNECQEIVKVSWEELCKKILSLIGEV